MTAQAMADSQTHLAGDLVERVRWALPSTDPELTLWALVYWLRLEVSWVWADPAVWVDLASLLDAREGNCRGLSTALVALLVRAGYLDRLSWGVGFADDGASHVWPIFWGPRGQEHLDASTWLIEPGDSPFDAPDSPLVASWSLPL